VGLGFYVTNKAFGYIVLVYGVPPLAGALVPMNVFLIAALVMYRRVL
jgi:lipopolysaccharide export LptBFGC system permease protein LptF